MRGRSDFCLLGATDEDLAKQFKVCTRTIERWKVDHEDFCRALTEGKRFANAKVSRSLYQRAIGYSHPEVKVFCTGGEITTHEVIKHYPPDVSACKVFLYNREPELWKDKVEVQEEVTVRHIPWDKLREISAQALAHAEEEHKRLIEGRAERLGIVDPNLEIIEA